MKTKCIIQVIKFIDSPSCQCWFSKRFYVAVSAEVFYFSPVMFSFYSCDSIVESNHLINLSSEQILIMFYSKENSWTNTSDKEYLTTKDTFKERDKPGYKP